MIFCESKMNRGNTGKLTDYEIDLEHLYLFIPFQHRRCEYYYLSDSDKIGTNYHPSIPQ